MRILPASFIATGEILDDTEDETPREHGSSYPGIWSSGRPVRISSAGVTAVTAAAAADVDDDSLHVNS